MTDNAPWADPAYDPAKPGSYLKAFGLAVTQVRERIPLTRRETCEYAQGMPYTTLASIESGVRAPTPRSNARIAQGLGVQASDLWSMWNALRTSDPTARVAELQERLVEQGTQTRKARENEASRLTATIKQVVEAQTGSTAAAQSALQAHLYADLLRTTGAAIPSPDSGTEVPGTTAAGAAVPAPTLGPPPPWGALGAAVSGLGKVVSPLWANEAFDPEIRTTEVVRIYEDLAEFPLESARLGAILKELREQQQTPLNDVARASGLTRERVEDIESGELIAEQDEILSLVGEGLGLPTEKTPNGLTFTDGFHTRYSVEYTPPTQYDDPRGRPLTADERANLGWTICRIIYGGNNPLSELDTSFVGLVAERIAIDSQLRDWLTQRYFALGDHIALEERAEKIAGSADSP